MIAHLINLFFPLPQPTPEMLAEDERVKRIMQRCEEYIAAQKDPQIRGERKRDERD